MSDFKNSKNKNSSDNSKKDVNSKGDKTKSTLEDCVEEEEVFWKSLESQSRDTIEVKCTDNVENSNVKDDKIENNKKRSSEENDNGLTEEEEKEEELWKLTETEIEETLGPFT